MTLSPRTTGWFHSNFKHMVDGGSPEKVRLPIPFYVIRHPLGVVLFDSGLGKHHQEDLKSWWYYRLWPLILPFEMGPAESAVDQLRAEGISPESVRFIIVSHLHYDHAGGLRDFPKATVVVSRKEWETAHVGRFEAARRGVMSRQLEGVESRLRLVDDQPGTDFGPFDASQDLLGDGSLRLLSTPGHTPGHESLLVTLGSGKRILLTGDAVWVRENYLWPAPKSWMIRLLEEKSALAWETTLKIRKFHEENPDVEILPGHDPHLWPRLPATFE